MGRAVSCPPPSRLVLLAFLCIVGYVPGDVGFARVSSSSSAEENSFSLELSDHGGQGSTSGIQLLAANSSNTTASSSGAGGAAEGCKYNVALNYDPKATTHCPSSVCCVFPAWFLALRPSSTSLPPVPPPLPPQLPLPPPSSPPPLLLPRTQPCSDILTADLANAQPLNVTGFGRALHVPSAGCSPGAGGCATWEQFAVATDASFATCCGTSINVAAYHTALKEALAAALAVFLDNVQVARARHPKPEAPNPIP